MSTSAQLKDSSRAALYHAGNEGQGMVDRHRDGAMLEGPSPGGAGIDEFLANVGYSVKGSADLDDVAQKLELLENVVGSAPEGNILQLLNEAMHNNPSEIAAWIETMIKELSGPANVSGAAGVYAGGVATPGLSSVPGSNMMGDTNSPSTSMRNISASSPMNMALDPVVSMAESQNCLPYATKLQQGFQGQPNMFMDKYDGSTGMVGSTGLHGPHDASVSETVDQQWQPSANQLSHNYYHGNSHPVSSYGVVVTSGGGPMGIPSLQDARGLPQQMMGASDSSQQQILHRTHLSDAGMSRSLKNAGVNSADSQILSDPSLNSHMSMMMEEAANPMVNRLPQHEQQDLGPSPADSQQVDAAPHQQEESGVRLVHLLVTCAQAVHSNDMVRADETVRQIQDLAYLSRGSTGPMEKVAVHFVDALVRRIYGFNNNDSVVGMQTDCLSELLHFQFYEICPYLKFAHFTANQAILEAFEGEQNVHIIDFNLMHGLQWPALIQALALRPGGPPFLRLTGIGLPQPGGTDVLQEIGTKLAQLAGSVNVKFDFRGVVATKLDDVKPWMLQVRQGEAVAVNSILQLHRLLGPHPEELWQVGNPGDISAVKGPVPAIAEVLQSVRSLNPKIVTLVEHEANHNSPVFIDRFMEALHYYSTMFDSLEACNHTPDSGTQVLAEMYLGREICNIVACEGPGRVERHENLSQWQLRMCNAGFQTRHLGANAYRQASMLLSLFSAEGYSVEETNGFLLLKWHDRPLMAASAWQCSQ